MILKHTIGSTGDGTFLGENALWKSMVMSSDATKFLLANTGLDQLYFSSNSGATLSKVGTSLTYIKVRASADFSILYALTATTLYKSINSGSTWASVLSKSALRDFAVSSDGLIIYATYNSGSGYDKIIKSTDGGTSWGADIIPVGTSSYLRIDCSTNGTIVYMMNSSYRALISTDSGSTWGNYATGIIWLEEYGISSSADGSYALFWGFSKLTRIYSNGTSTTVTITTGGNNSVIYGALAYSNAKGYFSTTNYNSSTGYLYDINISTMAIATTEYGTTTLLPARGITSSFGILYLAVVGTNYVQTLCAKRYYNGAWEEEKELMGIAELSNTRYYINPKVCFFDTEKISYWGRKYIGAYGVDVERKENGVYLTPELDILSGVSADLSSVTKRGANGIYWYVYLSTDQKICYAKRWNGSSWDNAETVFSKAGAMSMPRVSMNSSGNIAVSALYGSIFVRRKIGGSWGTEGSISPGSYLCTGTDHLFIDTSNNVNFVGRRITAMQYGYVNAMAWWHWVWNGTTFTTYAVSFPWCFFVTGNYYYDQNFPVFDSKPTGEILFFGYGVQGYNTPVWSHAYFNGGSWSNLTASAAATASPSDICYNSNGTWSVIAGSATLQINTWSGSWSGWSTFVANALNRGAAIVQDSQSRWHTVYTRQLSRPIITPTPDITSFIKSIDTHLRAVIKTVDGVPLALIKKVNDLT